MNPGSLLGYVITGGRKQSFLRNISFTDWVQALLYAFQKSHSQGQHLQACLLWKGGEWKTWRTSEDTASNHNSGIRLSGCSSQTISRQDTLWRLCRIRMCQHQVIYIRLPDARFDSPFTFSSDSLMIGILRPSHSIVFLVVSKSNSKSIFHSRLYRFSK